MSSFHFSYRPFFALHSTGRKTVTWSLFFSTLIPSRAFKHFINHEKRPVSTTDLNARLKLIDTFINPPKHPLSNSSSAVSRSIHNCCFECRCIFALVLPLPLEMMNCINNDCLRIVDRRILPLNT